VKVKNLKRLLWRNIDLKKTNLISSVLLLFGLLAFASLTYSQESVNFREFLEERLAKSQRKVVENGRQRVITGIKLSEVCDVDNDNVAERVFADYGAIFIAGNGVLFPTRCVFQNETQVQFYQSNARPKSATIGGVTIELQEPAMNALLEAVKEAGKKNLKITPRGGSEAARRSYDTTVELWNSRFYPALNYWVGKGKISRRDAEAAKAMQINEQVAQVLAWESKKLWFSKDLSKSILYSVAAPGASQHIFMLALDVEQFSNKQVRQILANHGWFQTVKSDLPHFTYLGIKEADLSKYGLKRVLSGGQEFWIPNLD
jgi:hypothetical protein